MPALTIVLVAVFFFGMGLYALAVPARVLAIFGVPVTTAAGRNEVRAVYGGYGIAIGAVLLVALAQPALRDGILVCQAVAVAGMAGGRVVSALVDRSGGFYSWFFCAVETVIAGALLAAAWR
jgi:hypothetical protein